MVESSIRKGKTVIHHARIRVKEKDRYIQMQEQMGTIEYLDHNQKTFMHNMTNRGKRKGTIDQGKRETRGRDSKPMMEVAEMEHWVVMDNT